MKKENAYVLYCKNPKHQDDEECPWLVEAQLRAEQERERIRTKRYK